MHQLSEETVASKRMGLGSLGSYIDAFTASMLELGYTEATRRTQLWHLSVIDRWMARNAVEVGDLNESFVRSFAEERRREGVLHKGQVATFCRLLQLLREQNVIPPAREASEQSELAVLERTYERYLRLERGLTTATVQNYMPFLRRFLLDRFGHGSLHLQQLGPADVSGFVLRHAPSMSAGSAALMITAMRSFLRFLLYRGEIKMDLAAAVPTVPRWRLSTLPKYLKYEEVERVLEGCDRSTSHGRRNYAILLLLARLGLRGGEVVALELADINWRAAEISVRGKGSLHHRLPLLHDVGQALADYLKHDRPHCVTRRVFVRMKAPHHGFASPVAVSTIVRRALERVGLAPPLKGAHLLRHSLATGMLRNGASMKEIGEVLRHRLPSTTEIYAKVDIGGLGALALPWPNIGGAQ